jgi:hypothetical protein
MRTFFLFLCTALSAATPAFAQTGTLPGYTLTEAGEAAVIGVFVCGLPPSTIDGMKQNVDRLVPGGSTSADFAEGEAHAQRAIQDVRESTVPDFSEMKDVRCPGVLAIIQDVSGH